MLRRRLNEGAHPAAVSFFRATYCAAVAAVTLYELVGLPQRYEKFAQFWGPLPMFKALGLGLPSQSLVMAAGALLVVTLVLAAAGVFTRPALWASVGLYLVFFGTTLGWMTQFPGSGRPSDHHTLHVWLLALLALSPGVGAYRLGQRFDAEPGVSAPGWPLLAARAVLGIAYLGAAYTKLSDTGLRWANGYNLQTTFLGKYATFPELEIAHWLGQHYAVCLVLSLATIGFELGFVTILLWPRRHPARWAYVAVGLGFHLATWLTMGIWQFLFSFCAAYLVFLEWPIREAHPLPDSVPAGTPAKAAAAVVALFALGVLFRPMAWPLADFATYNRYQNWRDQFDITTCEHLEPDGSARPCFGTHARIGEQVSLHLEPPATPNDAARAWLKQQDARVPPQQRRMLIGKRVRIGVRWFPATDGVPTVKTEQFTLVR